MSGLFNDLWDLIFHHRKEEKNRKGISLIDSARLLFMFKKIIDMLTEGKEVKMNPNTINLITNIVAALLIILEPIRSYLATQQFNWVTFAICIGSAIIAWYTAKPTIALRKEMVAKGIIKPEKKNDK